MTGRKQEIRIAAAIIRDEWGRFLLVRKKHTSAYMQPGGKFEPGECAHDALSREIAEELDASIVQSEFVGIFSAPAANEPGHMVKADVFMVSSMERRRRAPKSRTCVG